MANVLMVSLQSLPLALGIFSMTIQNFIEKPLSYINSDLIRTHKSGRLRSTVLWTPELSSLPRTDVFYLFRIPPLAKGPVARLTNNSTATHIVHTWIWCPRRNLKSRGYSTIKAWLSATKQVNAPFNLANMVIIRLMAANVPPNICFE